MAGANADLLGGAIALSLMVLAILHVTGNTLVDVVTAIFFSFHHDSTLLSRIVLLCAFFLLLFSQKGGSFMALFTIADLHLSSAGDHKMDVFGSRWQGYTKNEKGGPSYMYRTISFGTKYVDSDSNQ